MRNSIIILICLVAANVCFVSYAEKIQLCDGCTSITVNGYHQETCSTLKDTVDSSTCFAVEGRKGLTNFDSYNFMLENGSYVWYIYSDAACTPAKALLMGSACAKDSCCQNGGFYLNNNTQIFNAIRIGLPPNLDGGDDGLNGWEITLIVIGSILLVTAVAGAVVWIIKRNRASYQSV